MPNMHILVVAMSQIFPNCQSSGGEFFARLIDRLNALVGRVAVVSPQRCTPVSAMRLLLGRRGLPRMEWRGDMPVYHPRFLDIPGRRWFRRRSRKACLSTVSLAAELHRDSPFDVVLGYSFPASAYAAARIGDRLGVPSIVWAIGSDIDVLPNLSRGNLAVTRDTVRRSTLVLTESDDLRVKLQQLVPDADNVMCYYKGIDLSFAKGSAQPRDRLRERFGIPVEAECMFLPVIGIKPDKGVWEFFETFRCLATERPALHAVLFGGGADEDRLRRAVNDAGLQDRFHMPGRRPWEDVWALMQSSDVLLMPSHHEGLPNVVMEAFAAELPVVATDVGGVSEAVKPEETGLLVADRDVEAMVRAVRRVLDDPSPARAMARAGRELIFERFDVDKNVHTLHEMLKGVLHDDGRPVVERALGAVSDKTRGLPEGT
jgi:glycosyltransferase involved in cell wall biosynthesis